MPVESARFRKQTAAELRKSGKSGHADADALGFPQTTPSDAIDGAAEAFDAVARHSELTLEALVPLKAKPGVEEREYIHGKLCAFADRRRVNITRKLCAWFHDKKTAGFIVKWPPAKVIRMFAGERCESCDASFRADVMAGRAGIPSFWFAVKCLGSGAIRIMGSAPDVSEIRRAGCEFIASRTKFGITGKQLQVRPGAARKAGKHSLAKHKHGVAGHARRALRRNLNPRLIPNA